MASVNAAENITDSSVSLDDEISVESVENSEALSSNTKSFSDLNSLINDNSDWNVHLESNYAYNPTTDSQFFNGVPISRSINIYGEGYTINGNSQARIFSVTNYVNFNNINFIFIFSF